jgi:3-methyladenine DNA glycosylase AlkD
MLRELEKLFHNAANASVAQKQSSYLRDLFPFLGITKPQRELIEKPLFKKTPLADLPALEKIVLQLWKRDQREFHYTALCFAHRHRKLWTPETLPLFESMIRRHSWWDTVDTLAANHVGHLVKAHPSLIRTMDAWIDDPYLWIRRTAIIFQLRWKKETDEARLFEYCAKRMHEKEFFIRKAIGWALREYSKTNPKTVRRFVESHRNKLSNLSIREASKYL